MHEGYAVLGWKNSHLEKAMMRESGLRWLAWIADDSANKRAMDSKSFAEAAKADAEAEAMKLDGEHQTSHCWANGSLNQAL